MTVIKKEMEKQEIIDHECGIPMSYFQEGLAA